MKYRAKRLISICAAAALVLSLAACGSSDGSSTEETQEETSAAMTGEAGETYTGTVAAISEDSITVTTEDALVTIALSSETTYGYSMGENTGTGGGDPAEGESFAAGDMEIPEGESFSAEDMEIPEGESFSAEDMEIVEGESFSAEDIEIPEGESFSAEDMEIAEGESFSAEDMEIPEGESFSAEDMDIPEGETFADGDMGDAQAGAAGDMEMTTLTYEDISEGDTVTVAVGDDGTAESVLVSADMDAVDGDAAGAAGAETSDAAGSSVSSGVDSYTAVTEYTQDTQAEDETISSTGTDENAVLVQTDGITVTLEDVTILRESDDSTGGDNSSFYGVGASALVTAGTLIIEDSTITSDAAGGAGVFAYGDGIAYVMDSVITTAQDTSGGIHVAGGGTLYAWDLTVETSGESSAAIRSDRGSGTMVVDGGTYTSNGTGSPAVYSTADITVNEATLISNSSEAACIEGLNTIRLFDCDLTGNMADDDQNDCTWNVILYQSMSGDSEVGNSTFMMIGGSLTAKNGGMFYTTNTESTFIVSDVDITYAEDSEFLLKVTGNSNERGWGTAGENGADCTFTAIDQILEGTVIWDSISELDFYLLEGSTLTGDIVDDESQAAEGGDGYANLYIDETSTWIVTGDSTLSALACAGTIIDEDGCTVTIVGSDGTVYSTGTGSYTITVDSYTADVDISGASSLESFSDYEKEEP